MTRDTNEQARLFAQLEAIFDRRGVTAEERETIVALLTEMLLDGIDPASPPPTR